MLRPSLVLLLIASVAACNDEHKLPAAFSRLSDDEKCDFILDQLVTGDLSSESTVRSSLGRGAQMGETTQPNRHVEGAIDTVRVYQTTGLSVSFRRASGKSFLEELVVTDPSHIRYAQLSPGQSADSIRALLGPADDDVYGRIVYQCPNGGSVLFRTNETGTATELRLLYYVD